MAGGFLTMVSHTDSVIANLSYRWRHKLFVFAQPVHHLSVRVSIRTHSARHPFQTTQRIGSIQRRGWHRYAWRAYRAWWCRVPFAAVDRSVWVWRFGSGHTQ